MKRNHQQLRPHHGFTLVELLVAIAIIGILMGIAIPAISAALKKGRESAIRTEVESLSQQVEAYKLKYGDYPPDFFDWNLVVRHYRKVFPKIDVNELNILRQLCWDTTDGGSPTHGHDPNKIDRAEALVWSLGGFSSDAEHPFTGTGGPLQVKPTITPTPALLALASSYGYNNARDNAIGDFNAAQLTMGEYDATTGTAVSTEDGDLFPVYLRDTDKSPYLYFDSRTYGGVYTNPNNSTTYINTYSSPTSQEWGTLHPYLSEKLVSPSEGIVLVTGSGYLNFMNPNTFQILSAGLDDNFGTVITDPSTSQPVYFAYPGGQAYSIDSSASPFTAISLFGPKYAETSFGESEDHHLDNFTSFAENRLDALFP